MNIIIKVSIVFILFIGLQPNSLQSQTNWSDYPHNPVIDSDFDSGAIAIVRPSVVFDGASYHMWYSSVRVFPLAGNQFHLGCIGYATSPDGISWQSVNPVAMGPVLHPTAFDMWFASQGWVIADQDTFKMWYWGLNPTVGENALNSIGYAWSIDGSTWNRVLGPGRLGSVYDPDMAGLLDNSGVAMPCVVKDEGVYHMWHTHIVDEFFRIGYATSSDGIHWTKVNGSGQNGSVIDWGPHGRFDQYSSSWPAVIKTKDGFMMWYLGFDGSTARTGCSISADGIQWSLAPGVEASGACFKGNQGACVIPMDTQFKMWYAPGNPDHINLAYSDDHTVVGGPDNPALPEEFRLEQNFPNPFNPSTVIEYTVPEPC